MAGYLSMDARNIVCDGLFGPGRAPGAPAVIEVGFSLTVPTVTAGVLSGITEPAAGGYARKAFGNDAVSFPASAVDGVKALALAADWGELAAGWAGPDMQIVALIVWAQGGPVLAVQPLASPFYPSAGARVTVKPGAFTVGFPAL